MTIAIFNLDKHCSLVSYKGKVVVLMYIFAFIMELILTIVPLLLLCSIAEQFISFYIRLILNYDLLLLVFNFYRPPFDNPP